MCFIANLLKRVVVLSIISFFVFSLAIQSHHIKSYLSVYYKFEILGILSIFKLSNVFVLSRSFLQYNLDTTSSSETFNTFILCFYC